MLASKAPLAIILAAGVGRRIGGAADGGPKVLLRFGRRSLLERRLSALRAHGVTDVRITVGHRAEEIVAEVVRLRAGGIMLVKNSDYRRGSLLSLHAQAAALRSGRPLILMDGDVLCDKRMVGRLSHAPAAEGVLLVDRELEPGDEPVKVCFEGDRIVDFRKVPERPGERHGESVGFFRFSAALAAELADRCDDYVNRGLMDVEYEEAIRDLIMDQPDRFGAVDVTDLPWTEIDFEEDVRKASEVILPQLQD